MHCRGGQAGGLAQVGVAHAPILDEQLDDLTIQLLHAVTLVRRERHGATGADLYRALWAVTGHLRRACDERHRFAPGPGSRLTVMRSSAWEVLAVVEAVTDPADAPEGEILHAGSC
ncbi:hypothetical protein GCM10010230_61500 [Streptomyces narbonensis]|nr:hypothetical protein GCM10010230_61500 [Streptomyces narbonensis]